jgi:hypothetical protein
MMRIAVLGTGTVGRTVAARSAGLGHQAWIGTRDVVATAARRAPDAMGSAPFATWLSQHPHVRLDGLADAAAHAEVVVNATAGSASIDALNLAGTENLVGEVLLDVANPLDFSQGMPPTLLLKDRQRPRREEDRHPAAGTSVTRTSTWRHHHRTWRGDAADLATPVDRAGRTHVQRRDRPVSSSWQRVEDRRTWR